MNSEEGLELARQMGECVLSLQVRGCVVVPEMEKTEMLVERVERARDKVGKFGGGGCWSGRGSLFCSKLLKDLIWESS